MEEQTSFVVDLEEEGDLGEEEPFRREEVEGDHRMTCQVLVVVAVATLGESDRVEVGIAYRFLRLRRPSFEGFRGSSSIVVGEEGEFVRSRPEGTSPSRGREDQEEGSSDRCRTEEGKPTEVTDPSCFGSHGVAEPAAVVDGSSREGAGAARTQEGGSGGYSKEVENRVRSPSKPFENGCCSFVVAVATGEAGEGEISCDLRARGQQVGG